MNIIKRILGHIYFVYAILCFLVTMLVVVLPVLIVDTIYKNNESKRVKMVYIIFLIWMRFYMFLIFCTVRRTGTQNFAKGENYVVVLNHNSFFDIPISSPWVPGPNKTLAKSDFMKIPIFNIIYRSGSVLVDRRSEESRKQSFQKMIQVLQQGLHLVLYPEGTRNKTEKPLQEFKDGAFRTAIMAQKDVLPGLIFNTKKVLPDHPKFWGWPHTIRIEFLPPVSVKGLNVSNTQQLKEQVKTIMTDYYTTHQ